MAKGDDQTEDDRICILCRDEVCMLDIDHDVKPMRLYTVQPWLLDQLRSRVLRGEVSLTPVVHATDT
jgi:hypothetical protein